MELKKSAEANVDQLRLPIIAIGFLFVGSLVLASFSYTSGVLNSDAGNKDTKTAAVKFQQEEKKEEEPPVVTPPEVQAPPPIAEEIEVEKNTDDVPVAQVQTPPPPIPIGKEDKKEVVAEEIIEFPDVEASFPGGQVEMQRWISANIDYPPMAIENEDQGKVYLSFVVGSDGKISDITVERGVTPELDKEAKRMLRNMPPWVPGEAKGKKVKARCRLPIVFTLQ
jgi:protein TonB